MTETQDLSDVAAEFRRHFDQYYLGVIPRLLNEEGLFLSFLSMLAAVESLAGTFMPDGAAGDRFRAFVETYFPKSYGPYAGQLWKFRNRMVHSFNPAPFTITCHNSRVHLLDAEGIRMLNAEDFYADVVTASRAYFEALYSDPELQQRFGKRVTSDDGGRPVVQQIAESVNSKSSVAQQTHAARRGA